MQKIDFSDMPDFPDMEYEELESHAMYLWYELAHAQDENRTLRAENARLRGLVDELWALAYGYAPMESELDAARDMMRELGIEAGE